MRRSNIFVLVMLLCIICPNGNYKFNKTVIVNNNNNFSLSLEKVLINPNTTNSELPLVQARIAQGEDTPPFYEFSPDPIEELSTPILPILDFYSLNTGLNPLRLLNGTGINVTIAILSSGISGEAVSSLFISDTTCTLDPTNISDVNPWNDTVGHGTALASMLVGGTWGSRKGLVPDARLLNVKVFTGQIRSTWPFINEVKGDYKSVAAGIDWVTSTHPDTDIILVAVPVFGGIDDSVSMAVTKATNKGILVITPVGNYGSRFGTITSPACSPMTLSVGAAEAKVEVVSNNAWTFNPSDIWTVPSFSSRGPTSAWGTGPDIVAPGVDYGVKIPLIRNKTVHVDDREITGTGVAATYVAGGVAAILSTFYQQGVSKVRDPLGIKIALKNTAQWLTSSVGSVAIQGEGLVQFYEAWLLLNNTLTEVEGETVFNLQGVYPRHAPSEPWLPYLEKFSSNLLGPASEFQPSATSVAFCEQSIRIPFLYYQSGGSINQQLSLKIPMKIAYNFSLYPAPSYQEGYVPTTSFQQLQILLVEYKFAFSPKPYQLNESWQFNLDGVPFSSLSWTCLVIPPKGNVGLDYSHDADGSWEQDSFECRYYGWRKQMAKEGIVAQPLYNLSDPSTLASCDLIVIADPELPLSTHEYNTLTTLSQLNHSILLLFDGNDSIIHPFRALSKETQYSTPHQYYHTLVNSKGIKMTPYTQRTDDNREYPGLTNSLPGSLNYTISYVTTVSGWRSLPFDPQQGIVLIPMRGYQLEMFEMRNDSECLLRRDPQYGFEEFSRATHWSINSTNGLFVVSGTDAPFSLITEENSLDPLNFYLSNSSSLVMAYTSFLLSPRFPPLKVTPQAFPAILFRELVVDVTLVSNALSKLSGKALVHFGGISDDETPIWYGPAVITNSRMEIPLSFFYSGEITCLIHVQGEFIGQHWFIYTFTLTDSPFNVYFVLAGMIIGFIGMIGIVGLWNYRRTHIPSSNLCQYCLCLSPSVTKCEYCHRILSDLSSDHSQRTEKNERVQEIL